MLHSAHLSYVKEAAIILHLYMNILEYQIYQHIIYDFWKQSKEYRNINHHPNLSHPVERLKSCAGPAVPLA